MTRLARPRRRPAGAFTLLELMLVMLILSILVTSMAMPLATQVALRRHEETRRTLDEAREALLGFAAANGRLPCPASASSRGEESFAPGSDASDGNCAHFHDGYLPAAALGLSPLDPEGYVRDGWDAPANRVRYAVFGVGRALGGVTNPFTRANGMREATLDGLASAPSLLMLCRDGSAATPTSCGPAVNQLTRRAVFVLLSLGANAAQSPPAGSDERRNLDGDGVFVSHEPTAANGSEFDDYLTWVPFTLLAGRMIAAGRLP